MKTFRIGGVHPAENKLSAAEPIKVAELPKVAVFPMGQHIGAPAKPVVAKGDKVKVGTMIAEAGGFVSAPIFSSVSGTVLKVDTVVDASGYAKPAVIRRKNRKLRPGLQHGVSNGGKKILILQRVLHSRNEFREPRIQHLQKRGRIAPEVHGNQRLDIQRFPIRFSAVADLHDVLRLGNAAELVVLERADPPGHTAVVGEGVLHHIADERVLLRRGREKLRRPEKAVLPVVVIRVDHREGRKDLIRGTQNGVSGSPGLGAADGHRLDKHVLLLEGIGNLDAEGLADRLDPVPNPLTEIILNVMPDDKHDPVKAGGDRVVDAVVDDQVPVVVHGLQLLDPDPIAGADARCENHKCLIHLGSFLSRIDPSCVQVVKVSS